MNHTCEEGEKRSKKKNTSLRCHHRPIIIMSVFETQARAVIAFELFCELCHFDLNYSIKTKGSIHIGYNYQNAVLCNFIQASQPRSSFTFDFKNHEKLMCASFARYC